VVTLELHVREDMGDDDVLALTRWAWERCVGALASGSGSGSAGSRLGKKGGGGNAGVGMGGVGPEVTIGIVRG
jgi:hypothetical protein